MRYNALMTRPIDTAPDSTPRNAGSHPPAARSAGKPWLALAVLAVGLLLVALGVMQGDFLDTMRKAALVCYECIGIG